jgi:endonuclease YncB( thermonuclease family)
MADVVTSVFTTTLLVLYFVAPAKTVHLNGTTKAKDTFEQTQLWTLQSTSQITTDNPNACVADGLLLRQKFAPVSTVTVRLYCLCSEQAVKKYPVCDKANQDNVALLARSKLGTPPTAVIEIGPDTKMPTSSGPSE